MGWIKTLAWVVVGGVGTWYLYLHFEGGGGGAFTSRSRNNDRPKHPSTSSSLSTNVPAADHTAANRAAAAGSAATKSQTPPARAAAGPACRRNTAGNAAGPITLHTPSPRTKLRFGAAGAAAGDVPPTPLSLRHASTLLPTETPAAIRVVSPDTVTRRRFGSNTAAAPATPAAGEVGVTGTEMEGGEEGETTPVPAPPPPKRAYANAAVATNGGGGGGGGGRGGAPRFNQADVLLSSRVLHSMQSPPRADVELYVNNQKRKGKGKGRAGVTNERPPATHRGVAALIGGDGGAAGPSSSTPVMRLQHHRLGDYIPFFLFFFFWWGGFGFIFFPLFRSYSSAAWS